MIILRQNDVYSSARSFVGHDVTYFCALGHNLLPKFLCIFKILFVPWKCCKHKFFVSRESVWTLLVFFSVRVFTIPQNTTRRYLVVTSICRIAKSHVGNNISARFSKLVGTIDLRSAWLSSRELQNKWSFCLSHDARRCQLVPSDWFIVMEIVVASLSSLHLA